MSSSGVAVAFGVLFLVLAVLDWKVGGIRLWSQSWLLRRADRTRPLAELYENQRRSILSRVVSIAIGVVGAVLLASGVRGLIGRG